MRSKSRRRGRRISGLILIEARDVGGRMLADWADVTAVL